MTQGAFTTRTYGRYRYKMYIPTGYRYGTPAMLLVMLHGCTQSPDDFASGTMMNTYAEQHTFIVVYPDQPLTANPNRCWNWFSSQHQHRDRGEPARIMGIVEQVRLDYTIDSRRVHVAGISAGASMGIILGATYPDVFASLGVCSGVAYRAATSVAGALLVQTRGCTNLPALAQAAYDAMGTHRRVVPIIVFQGTADMTVAPINAEHIIAQWGHTNRLVADAEHLPPADPAPTHIREGRVDGGRSYTESIYEDHQGMVVMKRYLVQGMQHCWPGGSSGGTYTDPRGPNASALMAEFFVGHPIPAVAPARAAAIPPTIAPTRPVPATREEPVPGPEEEQPVSPPPPRRFLQRAGETIGSVSGKVQQYLKHLWSNLRSPSDKV